MTYHIGQTREAMTAIVAVLAFSSTPLLAQDTNVADPAVETRPAATDPLSPEPEAEPAPTTATETAAPPPAPRPKVETAPARIPRPAAGRTAPSARRAAPPPSVTPVAEIPVATVPPPAAEAPPVAAPVAPAPTEVPPTTESPATIEALIPDDLIPDDLLPVAGGAAAGLLAIGGLAMAIRRRRRLKEEDRLQAAKWAIIDTSAERKPEPKPEPEPELELTPEQEVEREPAFARTPAPMHDPVVPRTPVQANRPATTPSGLDISRFGPHVQAAYRGPTPDNPSVSLEYRLRLASILDQKEQDAAGAAARAAKVPKKGNWESRSDSDFLFRRAGSKNSAKPEFQG